MVQTSYKIQQQCPSLSTPRPWTTVRVTGSSIRGIISCIPRVTRATLSVRRINDQINSVTSTTSRGKISLHNGQLQTLLPADFDDSLDNPWSLTRIHGSFASRLTKSLISSHNTSLGNLGTEILLTRLQLLKTWAQGIKCRENISK